MNKLILDLNKLFSKPGKIHIVYAYDLLRKFDSDEWKHYIHTPEEGYTKTKLIHNNKYDYDLSIYSWRPGSICRENFEQMSVYKILQGRLYQFENTYEGTVGVPKSVKYIDYKNFDSLQTNMISHSLHIHFKN